jgi:tetratricopeptide (TPR) repeat protein
VAAQPRYLLAHYHLGLALLRGERFADAYRAFEHVLEIEPGDAEDLLVTDDALYRLGSIDLKMGAVERAAAFLEQVVLAQPGHPQAHHDYGEALARLGRPEEAAVQFDLHMRLQAGRETAGN